MGKLVTALSCAALAILLFGCDDPGPISRAGHATGDGIRKAGEKVGEAADKTGEKLDEASHKVKDAVR